MLWKIRAAFAVWHGDSPPPPLTPPHAAATLPCGPAIFGIMTALVPPHECIICP